MTLTALKSLDLSGTNVTDLEPLRGLVDLRSLQLSSEPAIDLTPVEALPHLEVVEGLSDAELQELNMHRERQGLTIVESR